MTVTETQAAGAVLAAAGSRVGRPDPAPHAGIPGIRQAAYTAGALVRRPSPEGGSMRLRIVHCDPEQTERVRAWVREHPG